MAAERELNHSTAILLVFEDEGLISGLINILECQDYIIKTAQSAPVALAKFKQMKINLALVDLDISGSTGLELARKIKKTYKSTIVILATKDTGIYPPVDAFMAGVDSFILKPINNLQTVELINILLGVEAINKK